VWQRWLVHVVLGCSTLLIGGSGGVKARKINSIKSFCPTYFHQISTHTNFYYNISLLQKWFSFFLHIYCHINFSFSIYPSPIQWNIPWPQWMVNWGQQLYMAGNLKFLFFGLFLILLVYWVSFICITCSQSGLVW
jgi:hypothetical protein